VPAGRPGSSSLPGIRLRRAVSQPDAAMATVRTMCTSFSFPVPAVKASLTAGVMAGSASASTRTPSR